MIRQFVFEANDPQGNRATDTVLATDVADAKAQLARMGYRDINMRTDELMHFEAPQHFDAGVMIDSAYDSLPVAVLKVFRARWTYLLPGALVLAWALWSGRSAWWGLGLLLAGLVFSAYRALPSVLYTQALCSRVHCKYARGLRCVSLLQLVGEKSDAMVVIYAAERSKMLAGLGRLDEALALFAPLAERAGEVLYLTHLGAIYESAGRRDTMLDLQRQLLASSGNSKEMRIDVAFSLMRYTGQHDEARQLVAGIHASQCADMAASGLRVVHGLLDQAAGRHAEAIAALQKEHAFMSRFSGNPLALALATELRAYIALSMKALGKNDAAAALWTEVLPFMRMHGNELLIARYDAIA
jgi:tetratricopeptide (TPR) repeat protein